MNAIRLTENIFSIGDKTFIVEDGVIKSTSGSLCITVDEIKAIKKLFAFDKDDLLSLMDKVNADTSVRKLLNELKIKVK
jgi:hypothetical protein